MTENQRILNNVSASMAMENMPLTEEEKRLGMECLEGRISFGEAIDGLVLRYMQE